MTTPSIEIHVNGAPRVLSGTMTVTELLASLGLGTDGVAVEVNSEVVTRARHASTKLAAGDTVEIVAFVGGG